MTGQIRVFLEGQKFGLLTVVRREKYQWICRCECGNESKVSSACLRQGVVKSCGCLKKKAANEAYHFDGGVTAIEINSPKYGQHFALIDTSDYYKVSGRRLGIRCVGRLNKRLYATIGMSRSEARKLHSSKDLHLFLFRSEVPNGYIVDHIDTVDTLDNRRINIRFGTKQQNTFNAGKQKTASLSSKYKGVHFRKGYGTYIAQIMFNYKNKYLGQYKTEDEAAVAYNNAAIKYFGDFAKLNNIINGNLQKDSVS